MEFPPQGELPRLNFSGLEKIKIKNNGVVVVMFNVTKQYYLTI